MFCVNRNVGLTVLFLFHGASPRELDVPNTFISMLITLADLHDMSKRVATPKTMRVKIQHALLAACSSAVSFFHAGIPGSVGSSDRYKPCALENAQPSKNTMMMVVAVVVMMMMVMMMVVMMMVVVMTMTMMMLMMVMMMIKYDDSNDGDNDDDEDVEYSWCCVDEVDRMTKGDEGVR